MMIKTKEYYETEATEKEFLDWYKENEVQSYDKPSVTADSLCFRSNGSKLQLLLVQRKQHPYKDKYALPGGFIKSNESAESCVKRELEEETSLTIDEKELIAIKPFSEPNRDPRHWIITLPYVSLIKKNGGNNISANDDAKNVVWVNVQLLSENKLSMDIDGKRIENDLAFDHKLIITESLLVMKSQIHLNGRLMKMLGNKFTLKDALDLYTNLDYDRFKKYSTSNFKTCFIKHLNETSEFATGKVGKPARFYTLKK